MSILQRDPHGAWRFARGINNLSPTPRKWIVAVTAIDYAKFRSRSNKAVIAFTMKLATRLIWSALFSGRSHQSNIRCVSGICHLLPLSHDRHEPLFDCSRGFRGTQAKRECFV